MRVNMTMAQAMALGIVRCKSCGHQPTGHFLDQPPKKPCAHCRQCEGYKPKIVLPKVPPPTQTGRGGA